MRIPIPILDIHKEPQMMTRLYTKNTSTHVRFSRACFWYKYEIRL